MNTLVYMTTRIIEAFECICDKCDYKWSSINLPATCANKTCRTPRWNREVSVDSLPGRHLVLPEKNTAEASPVVDKKTELDSLQGLVEAVAVKPKSDYNTKSVLPAYPVADQPDYYDSERSVNYD
jgi:hypothetical protein